MCSGSKGKLSSSEVIMENELEKNVASLGDHPTSILLELSAVNDLDGFKHAIEEEGRDIDEVGNWYGIRIGLKKMGFEERTPLMIAALFGSMDILKFILQTGQVDVNRASGSNGATALHCATAGGSLYSHEVVKLLVDSGADVNQVDCNGNRPVDVISSGLSSSSKLKRKTLDTLLNKEGNNEEPCLTSDEEGGSPKSPNDGNGSEKKEYPVDPSLPDIKNGIYGTDEFRMYTFKVKPCSRAYSHDWTECPFVHPGENARRRDPRKYHYSCVPCPEFRKGACPKGDACEYAHGIFECWLHPAQYRTRLCKDETKCARRVCFFAHKPEELRPLYASTGSAVPSPRSYSSAPSFDIGPLSPLSLGSPYMMMPSTSTPPITPTGGSSPIGGNTAWQNHLNIRPPPALQLPGSRLKAALCARDMDFGTELHRQQLLDEFAGLSMSSPTSWARSSELGRLGGLKPTNLDDMFGALDPSMLAHVHSPTGMQTRQSINQQLCSSYSSSGMPSSPVRGGSPLSSMESCGSPFSNARLASFANRSQSFIDRSTINRLPGRMPAHLSDWGSSDGQVEWGVQGDELNQLRKSASFGFRSNGNNNGPNSEIEPDVSWVNSLVKDGHPSSSAKPSFEEQLKQQYYLNSGGSEMIPAWVEQLYMEQEPMAA
ncbi:hypothetical protein KSS87_005972 [Heliosperma pusillum]|nr:hypothetical protein KSS87_005972 [Heliosperma pusillum]